MTPQEQQMLNDFLGRISRTPAPARDPEADAMIAKTIGTRPDALYLLTQLALIQEISLKQAQQQIQDLQQRAAAQPAPASSSFLGGPWGQQPAQQPQPAANSQQNYANAPAAPSFLHSALTTASGVVAGEMAFSAIRSLFGGGFSGGGMPGMNSGFLGNNPSSETTINNYYGQNNDANDNTDDSADLASDSDDSGDLSDSSDFS